MRSPACRWLGIMLLTLFSAAPGRASACVGDCGGDGKVSVDELILCVNLALTSPSEGSCPAADTDRDGRVSIDELVAAVRSALDGCTPLVISQCSDGFGGGCPLGTSCRCCCGVYRCLTLDAICCDVVCTPF